MAKASKMKCIEIAEPGDPNVLVLNSRPIPVAAPGEVLVKVNAAGVNGPDIVQRKGLYPPPQGASDLLGLEVAGTVKAVGDGVVDWSPGDAICGLTNGGGYAEYVSINADHCLPIPAGLSFIEAASLPETYFTIWSNIFMTAELRAGEIYLVHGGAGGLGTTSIQLAKAFGASVIATDSPYDRCIICKTLGADRVIDYQKENFVDVVRKEYAGAHVILDTIGGPYIERNIKSARPDARIIQLAFNLGSRVEINLMPIMLKRIIYTGSTLRSRSDTYKSEVAKQLNQIVWPLFEANKLKSVVENIIPLENASKAHALMERAEHTGKIVLTP